MTAPLVFVDTETTSLRPDRQAWEIGMIRRTSDGTAASLRLFVAVDLYDADPASLGIGRFYERHPFGRWIAGLDEDKPLVVGVDDAADERSATTIVTAPIAAATVARMTHGAHLVGAVPSFDAEVLGNLLRSHGLQPAWHYHLVDVEALAVGYLAGRHDESVEDEYPLDPPPAPPWKSDDLTTALRLPPVPDDERHTALGDARWAMRVYDAVMSGSGSR